MPDILFLTPSSFSNEKKGDFFEKEISSLLGKMRFSVIQRIRYTGMEIDILAKNKDTKQLAFVECKFYSTDKISSNVIDILIGKATRKNVQYAYLFSTTELGKEAKGVISEVDNSMNANLKFIFKGPDELFQLYSEVNNIQDLHSILEPQLLKSKLFGKVILIITPHQNFWLLERCEDGIPVELLIHTLNEGETIDLENAKKIIAENTFGGGLPVKLFEKYSVKNFHENPSKKKELQPIQTISQIPVAESFDDYRPCQPVNFVGRAELQNEFIDFFKSVRNNTTKTRILSLVGQSGFGKSSLILKMADKLQNKRWKNQFYLYHVDTRSAINTTFIAEAVKKGFNQAIEDGFIQISSEINIDNIDQILSSKSIKEALNYLNETKKVLIIFFDQFEELFVKNELFGLFENFKRLSFEVDDLQENFILGFSWRTGISFSEDHPAYYMWHELKDRRREFKIEKFDSREISQQLTILSKNLHQPLESQLKRRLKEQCNGLPWLLKKLSIHIFRQVSKGVTQRQLISTHFNIKQLFEDDTANLTKEEMRCLEYIAQKSPIDLIELNENFDSKIITSLYETHRLIVRTGYNYTIYWDIFRDFLVTKKLPKIPLTYVPRSELSTIFESIKKFSPNKVLSKEEFIKEQNVAEKTAQNILSDLLTLFIIEKSKGSESYILVNEIRNRSISYIIDYLSIQFRNHQVILDILENEGDESIISTNEFKNYVKKSYENLGLSKKSLDVYSNKLMRLFNYCGLLDIHMNEVIIYESGNGKQKGTIQNRLLRGKCGRKPNFLCSSSFTNVRNLMIYVISNGYVQKDWIFSNKLRNAAYDACALNILEWHGLNLKLSEKYSELYESPDSLKEIDNIIKKESLNSEFIKQLIHYLNSEKEICSVGDKLSKSLGKKWTESSKRRHISAGVRWLKDIDQNQKLLSSYR